MNADDRRRNRSQVTTHAASAPVHAGPDGFRRIDAADLFGPAREVLIRHAGQAYRLRVTASG